MVRVQGLEVRVPGDWEVMVRVCTDAKGCKGREVRVHRDSQGYMEWDV